MTHTFLLEIGLEDMPAHVVLRAEKQLIEKTKAFLEEAKLSFGNVTGYSTPRRFTVKVEKLADKQPDENLIVRGPAKRIAQDEDGNWTKAAIGFSKGQGGNVEDLIIKDENGEPYVFMEKFIQGKQASEILREISSVIKNIEFPKNMKWGTTNYQYVRPIHWLVALLDEEVVPFEVFDVKSGNQTTGHRFLGETAIAINHPDEYEEKLESEFVIADRTKRQSMIIGQLEKLCEKMNWQVPAHYQELLEEVTDLVEYPTVFFGEFEDSYLNIPEVVLETSMIDHQRYFPVKSESGKLLPYFISVRNGDENHIENVARGNEKVLSARLADAKFFYEEDQKSSIDDFVEKLKHVDYHDQLGTIYDKQTRATRMVEVISEYFKLSENESKQLSRVAGIYKFDLVTQVIDEFPTLQGTIGQIYALDRNEEHAVVEAIGEQYFPLSVTGNLPESKLGRLIALIDKLDSLIQFFSVGLIPTGSNDPYALRRQAIGVVRILLELDENSLEIDKLIDDLVKVSEIPAERETELSANKQALIYFVKDRFEQIMQSEYGISHDVRQAALGSTYHNLPWIIQVARELEKEKEETSFKTIVESITRVMNMTKNQGVSGEVNVDLFETESEKHLALEVEKLSAFSDIVESPQELFKALSEISPYITEFFDHNMIMVDDEQIKNNRLTLLSNLASAANKFADFSKLVI